MIGIGILLHTQVTLETVRTVRDSIRGGHSLNEVAFSAHDRYNDLSSGNCAATNKGGWWYNACMHSQQNSIYHHDMTQHQEEQK